MTSISSTNKITPQLVPALFALFFFGVWGYSIPLIAGLYIVSDLGGSHFMSTYPVSFYGAGSTIGICLSNVLAKKYDPARALLGCLVLYIVFNVLTGLSTNFFILNVMCFFQGLVSGPFSILARSLISVVTPFEKRKHHTAISLTIMTVVPAFSASWGGIVAYVFHWSWAFYFNIPFLVAIAFILQRNLKAFPAFLSDQSEYNWKAFFFYALWIFLLTFVLTTGQEFDWQRSSLIVIFTLLCIIAVFLYFYFDYSNPNPVVNLKLFKNVIFSFAILNLVVLYSAYFGMVLLLSLWLHLYVNYTPLWIGLLIGTMAVAGILPTFLLRLGKTYHDCRIHLGIALLLFAISSFHTATFNSEVNYGRIAFSRILAGFGLAFFLPPIFRLCYHTFPPEKSRDISLPFQFMRTLGKGLGGPLYVILWQRRQVFYHERLGADLTPFSQETLNFFARAKQFNLKGLSASEELDILLNRQATSLALEDCFFLMGWIFVITFLILLITLALRRSAFCPETCTVEEAQKPLFEE